jgi:hypothetical protein
MRIMKRRTAGRMFAGAGLVFLLLHAIRYLSGTPTRSSFVVIGMALVVIGAGIAKFAKKNGTPETH